MAENKHFSVLALFILFRETLEAAVIISVLLQYMNRTRPAYKRPGALLTRRA
jgi:high-affinity iron transporter